MRFAGIVFLLSALLLQGCEGVMMGVRIVFPIFMFVVIVGALFYAIFGKRAGRRENDRRTPDADDNK